MNDTPEPTASDWDLAQWQKALTIHVGATYVCSKCENLAMVTRGGVGVMELVCCGQPMDKIEHIEDVEDDS